MSQHENVRIDDLLVYVREGRFLEAMAEFYAPNVTMEDPSYGATHGLDANIERERAFLKSLKELRACYVPKVAKSANTAMYENILDWVDQQGKTHHVEQVSVQTWKNGKIIHERFYYHA